ncbi:hypothetical protein [Conexibacter sp. SYSU D00693]|uniref:hypothetical protein n=1 Tax=Conexibacter sp. SYSU D00693 TaxID=2812560 RepID=UPI00196AE683|nr:hypothetical protein [Conexibacter sp. SYSU D00693]
MGHRLGLLFTLGAAGALAAPAAAGSLPPVHSGCGDAGPTQSDTRPTASLASKTLTLRYTGRARMRLIGNQTAAVTVAITQAGGRRVGGTSEGGYTCSRPEAGLVALPINEYGRRLVRRHGSLRVRLTLHLVNGSGVRNTVRLSGVIRPE